MAATGTRAGLGRRPPGSSAGSRGGGRGCCCGRRRPPPLSPYRTRGPGCALALRPEGCSPRFPEAARRAGRVPPPERGAPGRKCAGRRRRRAGGGGEQARPGRRGAPSSSVAHSGVTRRKRRPLTARPSLPPAHRQLLRQSATGLRRRRPPGRALAAPGPAAAQRTARPRRRPLPVPRRPHPAPRATLTRQGPDCCGLNGSRGPCGASGPAGDDDRYPNGQSHCHPRDSPAAVVASARTHAQSTLSPLPRPFLSLRFPFPLLLREPPPHPLSATGSLGTCALCHPAPPPLALTRAL